MLSRSSSCSALSLSRKQKRRPIVCMAGSNAARFEIMRNIIGTSAGILLSISATQPVVAAELTLTQSQLREAEDLYELIRQRTGKDLPKLMSSPNVKANSVENPSLSVALSEADAKSIAQLKAELERMNSQLRQEERLKEAEKAELIRLQETLEQLRSYSAPGSTEAKEEDSQGGAFGFLNVLGILVGGGLGGYVFLQKKQADAVQQELDSALSGEQKLVADLKEKALSVQASLTTEQDLVSKLKKEMQKVQQDNNLLLATEKREKESALKASELASKALEAERNLVKAVRREAAAAQEQAQAERAAKFVAEAESAAISRQLKDTQDQMDKERVMARKVGLDASKAMTQAKTMEEALGKAIVAGEALKKNLAMEQARGDGAEGEAADLQRQIAQAETSIMDQQGLLKRVGEETMSMKEAMAKLKTQSGDIALKAQKEASAASEARIKAEAELKALQVEIDAAKKESQNAKSQAEQLRSSLSASENKVLKMESDLLTQRKENEKLKEEIAHLQGQLSEAEQALNLEQATSRGLRQELIAVQAQLVATRAELELRSKEFESERQQRAQLQASYKALSSDLAKAASQLENERIIVAELKVAAEQAERRALDAAATTQAVKAQLAEVSDAFAKRLSAAASAAETAETQRAAAEKKAAALTQEASDAKSKLAELEAVSKAIQAKSSDDQAAYVREVSAAKKRIAHLEASLGQARVAADMAAQSSSEANNSLSNELKAVRNEAEKAALKAAQDLMIEKESRANAEISLLKLRSELEFLQVESESSRRMADQQMTMLQTQIQEIKAKQEAAKQSSGAIKAKSSVKGDKVRKVTITTNPPPAPDTNPWP